MVKVCCFINSIERNTMKKIISLIAAATLATSAFAGAFVPENVNTNTNSNLASANQGQQQGQAQLQGQAQGQQQTNVIGINNRIDNEVRTNAASFASSNSGGNKQSVTVTDSGQMHYSGSYEVKNVPTAIAPTVYPTSPCMGSTSAGASGVGFGVSFGSSWTDDECGIRETARSFAGMQLKEDALAILCSSKYAAVAPACKKAEEAAK